MMNKEDKQCLEEYSDDVHMILECCNRHVMTLNTCREIIELMAPLCDCKSPSGAIKWLMIHLAKEPQWIDSYKHI